LWYVDAATKLRRSLMRKRLADTGDDFTMNVIDDNGKLCLAMRFRTREHRDAAIDAMQKMLDAAESVARL